MQPALPLGWVSAPLAGSRSKIATALPKKGADVDVAAVGADDDHVRADQRPAAGTAGNRQAEMQPKVAGSWSSAPVDGLRAKAAIELLSREVA